MILVKQESAKELGAPDVKLFILVSLIAIAIFGDKEIVKVENVIFVGLRRITTINVMTR